MSPDGKLLAFNYEDPTGQDIWILSFDDRKARPFLQDRGTEVDATFSPDGRWLAYSSDESGRFEIYVKPFPGPGEKRQISSAGGRKPLWTHSGRELFYRNGEKMMVVGLSPDTGFRADTPALLFSFPSVLDGITADYDLSADDQRFLMIRSSEQELPPLQFNVVLNWLEELKRKVPVR